ncbi:MAG: tetratricopeptide repeat protein [Gemmatimonadales bacterium]
MAIKGSLQEASLPDVLQLLALGQKTGCLTISDRSNLGYIYFDQGRICYSAIVNRRDRLGDLLVKNGEITQQQLDAAIEVQAHHRDKRLGELLVESGAISRESLERYMRVQIEEAIYFLFTWASGTFTFESDARPEAQDFLVSISPGSLLLEGARRVDEWTLIEKKVPSFDLIFTLDRGRLDSSEATFSDEQERVIALLDGRRDVRAVVEESGLGEFEVGKVLYGLITAGFLHRTGRSEAPKAVEGEEGRVEEHRNLGVAFYRTGMYDEATREFRRVVDIRPSDGSAHFYLGLIAARRSQWEEAVQRFTRARECGGNRPTILYNLALSYERSGSFDEAEDLYAEAVAKSPNDPRILMGWGIAALHRGDYDVAIGRLDRAFEVSGAGPPGPLWYWARSLAAAALERYPDAEKVLREGIDRYPDHVVLRNNLAVLLEILGDTEGAEETLGAALAVDPSLPHLSKNLGDLYYRAGRYDEAWEAYRRAVKQQPNLGDDVYFKLGNIAYRRLDREAATEFWNKTIELNPQHELARTNLDTMSAVS